MGWGHWVEFSGGWPLFSLSLLGRSLILATVRIKEGGRPEVVRLRLCF